jgi:hypothetical protein
VSDFNCLLIFLGLFTISVVLAFVITGIRKKLVPGIEPSLKPGDDREKWQKFGRGSFRALSDWRRLFLVRHRLSDFPEDIQLLYARYTMLSRVQNVIIVAIILFALLAGDICS